MQNRSTFSKLLPLIVTFESSINLLFRVGNFEVTIQILFFVVFFYGAVVQLVNKAQTIQILRFDILLAGGSILTVLDAKRVRMAISILWMSGRVYRVEHLGF